MKKRRGLGVKKTKKVFVVVGVSLVGVTLFAGLMAVPLNTWVRQQNQKETAEAELLQLEIEVANLEHELYLLGTDHEVERRARKDLGLVFPGEESYRVITSIPE